jgi:hypothetical protein
MSKISLKEKYLNVCRTLGAAVHAPTRAQAQFMLFAIGVTLLTAGYLNGAQAAGGHHIDYNDVRLGESINAILTYIEGTFGAMVMVAAGIGAILSSAFGQYRAALGLLVVAVGAFILRSLVGTFFNDNNIQA